MPPLPLPAAHPTRLRDEPEQDGWSRAPSAELRLGAATAPLRGLPRRSPGPSRSDQTLGPSIHPQPGGKGPPFAPRTPEPRSRNCSAQLTPPPGARVPCTPPASGNPHGPVLPARPPGAPPALLGGEALHTPPPPRQDRHTLTHIIHTPAAMFRGWMVMQLKRPEIAQAVKRNTRARVGQGRLPGEMARDGTRSPSDPAPGSPHSSQTSPLRQLTQARPAHSSTDR